SSIPYRALRAPPNASRRPSIWSPAPPTIRFRGDAMKHTRREFLLGSGCLALSGAAYASSLNNLSLMNLFASATGRNDANYKALVCIFLFGGNDANNLLIPYDDYALYEAARTGAPFQIPQQDLAQIYAPSQGATYGLPQRTPYDTSGLQSLYADGKLAFVCN